MVYAIQQKRVNDTEFDFVTGPNRLVIKFGSETAAQKEAARRTAHARALMLGRTIPPDSALTVFRAVCV